MFIVQAGIFVNKYWISEHTSNALRYGTRFQGISQFYLHTPCSSANGMNHTCICLPSRSWYSFTDPRGIEGWVGLGGWLHTEINVRHQVLNPDTVIHVTVTMTRHTQWLLTPPPVSHSDLCQTALEAAHPSSLSHSESPSTPSTLQTHQPTTHIDSI